MTVVTVTHDGPLLPSDGSWTVDDLDTLPADGLQYELFDGVLVVSPAPLPPHQRAVGAIYRLLHAGCPDDLEVFVAPLDFRPTHRRSLQPDVLVARRAEVDDNSPLHLPPVLVVEILSRSTASKDQIFKRALYAESEIPHFWIFDPTTAEFTAYELRGEDYAATAKAVGAEATLVMHPYPVRICPAELVAR
jgi:Uma2 family endonuclease